MLCQAEVEAVAIRIKDHQDDTVLTQLFENKAGGQTTAGQAHEKSMTSAGNAVACVKEAWESFSAVAALQSPPSRAHIALGQCQKNGLIVVMYFKERTFKLQLKSFVQSLQFDQELWHQVWQHEHGS